jgi:heme/copper-type cytochrome/quinol oxidase subunit 2
VLGAAVLLAASAPASAGAAASGATGAVQTIAITIVAGDRVAQAANFALAPGVPVRLTVTNDTRQFHTFTVPGLHVSELILPGRTTSFEFTATGWGAFAWHCIICPSGMHGHPHTMGGTLYLIIAPSALG